MAREYNLTERDMHTGHTALMDALADHLPHLFAPLLRLGPELGHIAHCFQEAIGLAQEPPYQEMLAALVDGPRPLSWGALL